jgi:hypothetical protein
MPATEDAVTAAVEHEPSGSSRDTARELGLPQALVLNTLHDDELHPYHNSQNQHQLPVEHPLWMQFCEWLHQQHTADVLYENILWTDEACFTCDVEHPHGHLHSTRTARCTMILCFSSNSSAGAA